MAQSKTTQSYEFDSVIIGGGLSGLIAAHVLEGTGRKVALIEGLDAPGGSARPVQSRVGVIDHGLKLIADSPESREALEWLGQIMGQEIPFETVEAPVVTYDEGKFKPFVGFGEQKVRTAHEIDAYAKEKYLRTATTPKDWVPELVGSFTGTLLTQSYVTKMQVDDEFVIELLINGAKRISGREVVFCTAPQQLAKLLPESHVPTRLRQKLLKGGFWTSINLDLVHASPVTDSLAVHVLKGANEEPSVGLFHVPVANIDTGAKVQLSQWLTLVPRDLADDDELVAASLKHIKRQIKRAYETSLEGLLQERIVVQHSSHGDLSGALAEDGRWPKLQNLFVASGLFDPAKNLVGTIRQVRRTLATIAGEPAETLANDDSSATSAEPQPTA